MTRTATVTSDTLDTDRAHGSRAAVLRRSEATRFSSPSDDEVGGYKARSAPSELGERGNQIRPVGRPQQAPRYADDHAPAR